ncbi:MAG: hypothetical protein DMF82_25880 [Acidobacteria bacterium]|nr:MAG: hypothetical protein DMF82_25880 [Acidobacteriota bacterium]
MPLISTFSRTPTLPKSWSRLAYRISWSWSRLKLICRKGPASRVSTVSARATVSVATRSE